MMSPAHYQTLEFRHVDRMIGELTGAKSLRVLDFGCGHGKYLDCFLSHRCDVTAVDTSAKYVAEAARRGVEACTPEQLFAKEPKPFDVIFLSHVIEHLAPDDLVDLIPRLCRMLSPEGSLILISPTYGERFYHDFSHIRPYLPQSIRHAFGQTGAPLSFGENRLIEMVDIHFFRDPFRTRSWRSFYVGHGPMRTITSALNKGFDFLWRATGGRIGVIASWLGVYRLKS